MNPYLFRELLIGYWLRAWKCKPKWNTNPAHWTVPALELLNWQLFHPYTPRTRNPPSSTCVAPKSSISVNSTIVLPTCSREKSGRQPSSLTLSRNSSPTNHPGLCFFIPLHLSIPPPYRHLYNNHASPGEHHLLPALPLTRVPVTTLCSPFSVALSQWSFRSTNSTCSS